MNSNIFFTQADKTRAQKKNPWIPEIQVKLNRKKT